MNGYFYVLTAIDLFVLSFMCILTKLSESLNKKQKQGFFFAFALIAVISVLELSLIHILGDEMLTPDSSRFWPLEGYEPGHGQPSFDKQFVRDWLKAHPDSNYDLPQDVIDKTIAKYLEAYELLTGKKL